jgi:hypothetical protein
MSAIIVYFGAKAGWTTATFATLNAALAGIWLAFVVWIGREHARRADEGPAALALEPRRVVVASTVVGSGN